MRDRRNLKALRVADQIHGWGAVLITDAVESKEHT